MIGAPGRGQGHPGRAPRRGRSACPTSPRGSSSARRSGSDDPLGVRVRRYVESGALVPDEIVVEIVDQRLAKADAAAGAILDGFPRTLAQARALDELLARQGTARLRGPLRRGQRRPAHGAPDRTAGLQRRRPACLPRHGATAAAGGHLRRLRRGALPSRGRRAGDREGPSRRAAAADVRGHRPLRRGRACSSRSAATVPPTRSPTTCFTRWPPSARPPERCSSIAGA